METEERTAVLHYKRVKQDTENGNTLASHYGYTDMDVMKKLSSFVHELYKDDSVEDYPTLLDNLLASGELDGSMLMYLACISLENICLGSIKAMLSAQGFEQADS